MNQRGKSFAAFPAVCAVVAGSPEKRKIKKAKALGADMVEIRVDTFRKRDAVKIKKLFIEAKKEGLPAILTVRSAKEGGRFFIDEKERLALFRELTPFSDFVDVELGGSGIIKEVTRIAKRFRKKIIVSYHNFKMTPDEKTLLCIARKAKKAGASIVKIAAFVKKRADLRTLLSVLLKEKNSIVIGMGKKGVNSRVFFPLAGSLVTYGSIDRKTAPGQLPLKELKGLISRFG